MARESVTGMTQAERRAATQLRLLDAAIDTIADVGYVNASTTEIARRAGVSRGAQLHHFPTKVDLVGAALAHSMERRLAEYAVLVEQVPPGRARVNGAIDLLWQSFQTTDCSAWIEIAVAASHDPELRPHVAAASELHRKSVEELFARLFPPAPGEESSPFYLGATKFVVALLDGLVLHRMMAYDDAPGRADEIVEAMKLLAAIAFPVAPETTPASPRRTRSAVPNVTHDTKKQS
jgi:AcrR family transcriptional regulator